MLACARPMCGENFVDPIKLCAEVMDVLWMSARDRYEKLFDIEAFMKLGNIFSRCFTGHISREGKKNASVAHGVECQKKPPTSGVAEQLRSRARPETRDTTGAKPAPRGSLKRLIESMRPERANKQGASSRAEGVAQRPAKSSGRDPSFDLKLERGKVRVLPLHPTFPREQARRLENELNDKQNPVTGLIWNEAARGYTIAYGKGGARRWLSTAGPAMPVVALAPHHAVDDLMAPPPVGLIAGLSSSADGALWRVHHGKLYQWDAARTEWTHVQTATDGRTPVELMGRQLDGLTWARYGSTLMKLGAEGIERHQLRDGGRYAVVRIGPGGECLALDADGRLCSPDEPSGAPRPIMLQLADGRAAFDTIELGNPNKPVKRARAIDFQLAPDGKTLFLRDGAGHLYRADFRGLQGQSDGIVARRVANPMHQAGAREGWRADALAVAPGSGEGQSALHAIFSSSNGQRVTAVWDGNAWKPQFHVEQPLLLINDRGLDDPDMDKVLDYGNGASLGISEDGHIYTREGERGWQPLSTADGRPVPNVVDLKLGPSGLSDAKPVYARQQDLDGTTRILKLDVGGTLSRLPARAGGSVVALPARQHVSRITMLAKADAPMLDFAVDGKGVAYHLSSDRRVMRTAAQGQPEQLPALPGRTRIQQIAVSGDGNQLFALARGPLQHGDAPGMPTLFRFDQATASWSTAVSTYLGTSRSTCPFRTLGRCN